MRVKAPQRRSTPDSWPTSSILGPTSRRLGTALVAIGALWMGVLWVILTPPREAGLAPAKSPHVIGPTHTPPPQEAAPLPQPVRAQAHDRAGPAFGLDSSLRPIALCPRTLVLSL